MDGSLDRMVCLYGANLKVSMLRLAPLGEDVNLLSDRCVWK